MRRTHNRAQRYGGHTKHSWECICGRVVSGNGGKQHFKLEGHRRLNRAEEEARLAERIASAPGCRGEGRTAEAADPPGRLPD